MSRVERTDNPSERRGSEHLRQAQRRRQPDRAARNEGGAGRTPTKAEGEERDVEEALKQESDS